MVARGDQYRRWRHGSLQPAKHDQPSCLLLPSRITLKPANGRQVRHYPKALGDGRVSWRKGEQEERKVHELQLDTGMGQPSACATRFAARHLGTGNLAFCDENMRWYSGPSVVETRPVRKSGEAVWPEWEVIWSPDPLDDPRFPA